jgi:hypothetical protein
MSPITVGLFHANSVPPKSSPSNNITISPRIVRVPNQSTALIPTTRGVRGLCTSRKKRSSRKAVPEMGRLIQNIQRQEMNSVKTPPRSGPLAPATAQMKPRRPIYRLLSLFSQFSTNDYIGERLRRKDIPHAKQIRNGDIDKLEKPTAGSTLTSTPHDEHFHAC